MTKITTALAHDLLKLHTNKLSTDTNLLTDINAQSPSGIEYVNIKHRLYHIAHSLTNIPRCIAEDCNSLVKWDKQNQKYTQTCGYSCSNKMTAANTMVARLQTNNIKYGGNAPACSEMIRDKMVKTNIKRYGDDYTKIHSKKLKQSLEEKYGIENISQKVYDTYNYAIINRFNNFIEDTSSMKNIIRFIKIKLLVN